jgi:hypothetical protein
VGPHKAAIVWLTPSARLRTHPQQGQESRLNKQQRLDFSSRAPALAPLHSHSLAPPEHRIMKEPELAGAQVAKSSAAERDELCIPLLDAEAAEAGGLLWRGRPVPAHELGVPGSVLNLLKCVIVSGCMPNLSTSGHGG